MGKLHRKRKGDEKLINNLRILVGILFGPIAFEGLRDNIFFNFDFISWAEEKRICINWEEKIMKIIF